MFYIGVISLFVLISGCTPLEAVTTYQGQLTDSSGNPVTEGNYQITFRLYNVEDDDVGDALWTETQTVLVNDGLFNVMLGAVTTIPTELFVQKLWLGVEVENDGEMTPRQQLTGAPYAMSLVAGAGIQGKVNKDDPLPGSLNVHNSGTGYGIGVNALGKAGIAIDGSLAAENGLLIDNVLHGAVITGTEGIGLKVISGGTDIGNDDGVRAEAVGDGLVAETSGTKDQDYGVYSVSEGGRGLGASTSGSGQYAGYFFDPIYVHGGCTGCTLSYVGRNISDRTLQLGDVVGVSGMDALLEGLETPVIQVSLATPDQAVLGVVLGRTTLNITDSNDDSEQEIAQFGPVGGDAAPGDYLVIVVQGPAQVRAADANIQPGDLVYQASDGISTKANGPAIGMALDGVDAEGLMWVLVGFH
jgi:hypothetical protein